MAEALINPDVLQWARKRSQMTSDYLAEKAHIKVEKLELWEQGEAKPTFRQAQNLAHHLHIPFGYLFLRKPPKETVPIPDLRTVGDRSKAELSVDLKEIIKDVQRKQDWYRDYLQDQGVEQRAFVGRFTVSTPPQNIADNLTTTLKLTINDRKTVSNWEGFLNLLMTRAEEAGVWVLRSGIVGSNTHRGLDVNEFRGYAVCDNIAPLVFINGSDAKAAQIFTLAHELAHIWVGQSGISNPLLARPKGVSQKRVEKLCNAVAAEVLVPHVELQARWDSQQTIGTNAASLSKFFRVSEVVIARRAYDLNLVVWDDYNSHYRLQAYRWKQEKESKESGGSYYRNQPIKNGRRFTSAVIQSVYEQRTLLRDAGKLLGVNPAKIGTLAEKIGVK